MPLTAPTLPRLGLCCWPLSGPFTDGTRPLGYADCGEATAIRAIHAAWDAGLRLFDTAAV